MTPRYVQMLFDEEGTTFTDFVLRQRLARAHRMLSDPRYAEQKIAALAYNAGFNDPVLFRPLLPPAIRRGAVRGARIGARGCKSRLM